MWTLSNIHTLHPIPLTTPNNNLIVSRTLTQLCNKASHHWLQCDAPNLPPNCHSPSTIATLIWYLMLWAWKLIASH